MVGVKQEYLAILFAQARFLLLPSIALLTPEDRPTSIEEVARLLLCMCSYIVSQAKPDEYVFDTEGGHFDLPFETNDGMWDALDPEAITVAETLRRGYTLDPSTSIETFIPFAEATRRALHYIRAHPWTE